MSDVLPSEHVWLTFYAKNGKILHQKQAEAYTYLASKEGMPKGSIRYQRSPSVLQTIYSHFAGGSPNAMRINNKLCFTTHQAEKAYNQGA